MLQVSWGIKKWRRFRSTKHCKKSSDGIIIQFGLDKCTKVIFKKGLLTELECDKTLEYIEINESNGISHIINKEKK